MLPCALVGRCPRDLRRRASASLPVCTPNKTRRSADYQYSSVKHLAHTWPGARPWGHSSQPDRPGLCPHGARVPEGEGHYLYNVEVNTQLQSVKNRQYQSSKYTCLSSSLASEQPLTPHLPGNTRPPPPSEKWGRQHLFWSDCKLRWERTTRSLPFLPPHFRKSAMCMEITWGFKLQITQAPPTV